MFTPRRILYCHAWVFNQCAALARPAMTQASGLHTSTLMLHNHTRSHHKKLGVVVNETAQQLDKQSPVVVILGWNDSRDKHLAKYSELFERRDYSTMRVTATPFNTFFRSGSKVKQIAHHILDTLIEMKCFSRPVFLYAFSNGGGGMFYHIMEALVTPNTRYHNSVNIAGTIFDSCPINPNMKSVKIVQESVTEAIRNPILRPLIWYSLGIFVPLVVYFNSTVKRYMSAMEQSTLKCPQLILYSKSDLFAPYSDIDEYMQVRKELGVSITAKCWEKSGHVNHYREHTEEYLKLLNSFVDNCFENKAN